jgi:hypothetical protein
MHQRKSELKRIRENILHVGEPDRTRNYQKEQQVITRKILGEP